MGFNLHGKKETPEALLPGFVEVVATAKGYHVGPREPGEKFPVPLTKDGKVPKASWFKAVDSAKPTVLGEDSDLA